MLQDPTSSAAPLIFIAILGLLCWLSESRRL